MPPRRRARAVVERRAANAEISDPSLVLAAALRFLEARPRSTAEVRRRLVTHGYRADLVEGCVARLLDLGVLDDEAFARGWVESRDRARPRGERALRSELARKGIERSLTHVVLEERGQERPDADADAARRVLARHESMLARVTDPRARRQRAYALLARNGFDSESAIAAIRCLIDDELTEPEP